MSDVAGPTDSDFAHAAREREALEAAQYRALLGAQLQRVGGELNKAFDLVAKAQLDPKITKSLRNAQRLLRRLDERIAEQPPTKGE